MGGALGDTNSPRQADAAPVRRPADAAPMRSIGGPQRPALDLYFFVCLASAMNTPP